MQGDLMVNTLKSLAADEAGAEVAEYSLLAWLVAIVAVVSVQTLGKNASTLYSKVAGSI
jgi:Flp pilus assembly pilin Flp